MRTPSLRALPLVLVALGLAVSAAAQPRLFPAPPRVWTHSAAPVSEAAALRQFQLQFRDDEGDYATFIEGNFAYAGGRVSEILMRSPDFLAGEGVLQNDSRQSITYSGDRVAQELYEQWDGGAWQPANRTTYTYNAAGLVTSQLDETFAEGAWRSDTRTTTTYSGDVPTRSVDEQWDGSAWVPTDRQTFADRGSALQITSETWDGSAWVNESRDTYPDLTLDAFVAARAALETLLRYNLFGTVPDRATAELYFALETTEETWDGGAGVWRNTTRTRRLGSTPAALQLTEENWVDDAWTPDTRTTLTFNGSLLTEQLTEAYDAETAAFFPNSRSVHTYDSGNPVLTETFSNDDPAGTLEETASQRIVRVYGEDTAVTPAEKTLVPSLTGIYPIPAGRVATVSFATGVPGRVLLRVFDVLGREVATHEAGRAAGAQRALLDVSALPAGVYLLRVEAPGGTATGAFVVAR